MPSSAQTVLPAHPHQAAWRVLAQHIQAWMQTQAVAAESAVRVPLVLVPFAQHVPLVRQAWIGLQEQQGQQAALLPRFETTHTWTASLPPVRLAAQDYTAAAAQDSLTAQQLLVQAGLRAQASSLYPRLLTLMQRVAPLAASQPPSARLQWLQRLQRQLDVSMQGEHVHYERILLHTALVWSAHTTYASDALFTPQALAQCNGLLVLQGVQPMTLECALADFWRHAPEGYMSVPTAILPLIPAVAHAADAAEPSSMASLAKQTMQDGAGQVEWLPCADVPDMVLQAAQAILTQVAAGHVPVALVAQDRQITRQIRAHLAACGAQVEDETGWRLATTHAAAVVVSALRAAQAPQDAKAQMEWLQHSGQVPLQVQALEKLLAKGAAALPYWLQHPPASCAQVLGELARLHQLLRGRMPLVDWLQRLQQALQLRGLYAQLQADAAGMACLQALFLHAAGVDAAAVPLTARLSLTEFAQWVQEVLDAATFRPVQSHEASAQVVILPLVQALLRPFAAVVLPGADAKRLGLQPTPVPGLTLAQAAQLGLPTPQEQAQQMQAHWRQLLRNPHVSVLWPLQDVGEEMAPSPLVQAWALAQGVALPEQAVARLPTREVLPQALPQALAQGAALVPPALSASAYADLRACPYRFYALRILGLQQDEELDADPDKRDWGNALHAILAQFHQARVGTPTAQEDLAQLLAIGQAHWTALRQQWQGSDADALLLPFVQSWPQLAASYVDWLHEQAQQAWQFARAEDSLQHSLTLPRGSVQLSGKPDRIDTRSTAHATDSAMRVLDYKTESDNKTRQRVQQDAQEDIQLPFYALLLSESAPAQALEAAYVNLQEQSVKSYAYPDLAAAAQALAQGIQNDMARITDGHPLVALGEGRACEHCAARGLCRKDFWSA